MADVVSTIRSALPAIAGPADALFLRWHYQLENFDEALAERGLPDSFSDTLSDRRMQIERLIEGAPGATRFAHAVKALHLAEQCAAHGHPAGERLATEIALYLVQQ